MEDSVIQERSKVLKAIQKMLKELRLEVISRSGLVPRESYVGNSSTFDVLWETTSYTLMYSFMDIILGKYDNLDRALQEYKDTFVNEFMTLHHKLVVTPSKFNWNWD